MHLQNLQAELAEILLADEKSATHQMAKQHALLAPMRHIQIYQNTIVSNLTQSLLAIYPFITALVGEDFFRIAAKEYIKHYPSRSSNLHDYGEYFSDFLSHYAPVNHLPYLAEVATLEWLSHTLHFAPEPAPFDTRCLEHRSPQQYEQLHFVLHPACRVLQCHYPLLDILDVCTGKKDALDIDAGLSQGHTYLFVMRREWTIVFAPLTQSDYVFLRALHDNQPLSQAVAAAVAIEANFQLEQKLPRWIKNHIIVDAVIAQQR